jgi:hypothetical protein
MKERTLKRRPTRKDLSLMWRMVRDQVRIIASQSDTIRRLEKMISNMLTRNRTHRAKTSSRRVN